VNQIEDDYVHVQFGAGCGWLHVFTNAATVYSPASWRPAPGDTVTVRGTGTCTDHATAAEIDLQQ
jgi:plastocyanin